MRERVHLHLTTGQGPAECRIAARRLIARLAKEAERLALSCDVAERENADRHGPSSAVIAIEGEGAGAFARDWLGTIQWIAESPVRPHHNRRNWFVGIARLPEIAASPPLDEREVRFESLRAGGPGGQHQNTTESAVRAVHLPTGLSVVVRNERSQHRNKATALSRLAALIAQREASERAEAARSERDLNHRLERGNAVRVFRGSEL